jgi:hypothetical protein
MHTRQDVASLDRLREIYHLYDRHMASEASVCKEKCADCCTCNVTITALEADLLLASLPPVEKNALYNRIIRYFPQKRFIPKMTFNTFARWCMEDRNIPEEENDPAWGTCPLLADDLCIVYDARPFGCRALMSQHLCREKGHALIAPRVVTANNLFLQAIEHLDSQRFSGNLSDMLTRLPEDEPDPSDERFVPNEAIPVLMVPPEHRSDMAPVIQQLSTLLTPDNRP